MCLRMCAWVCVSVHVRVCWQVFLSKCVCLSASVQNTERAIMCAFKKIQEEEVCEG